MQQTEWLLEQRYGVTTARAAKHWLSEIPISDTRAAQHSFCALLDELDEQAISAGELLPILETLRASIIDVQAAYSARYAGKPVPLAHAERVAFDHTVALWQRLEAAYQRTAEFDWSGGVVRGDQAGDQTAQALPWQRALWCAVQRLQEYPRGHRAIPPGGWASALRILHLAEQGAIADTPVRDRHHPKGLTTIEATFVRGLLSHAAAQLPLKEYDAACLVAQRWAHRATLMPDSPSSERTLDFAAAKRYERDVRRMSVEDADFGLNVQRLRRALQTLISNPDSVPEDDAVLRTLPQTTATRLLHLWNAKDPNVRQFARHRVSLAGDALSAKETIGGALRTVGVTLALDVQTAYLIVAGTPFAPPAHVRSSLDYTREEAERLFIFQHGGNAHHEADIGLLAARLEAWQVLDESATGFRLARPLDGSGSAPARVRAGQLVALAMVVESIAAAGSKPAKSVPKAVPVLCVIRWVRESTGVVVEEGALPPSIEIGIELIPGEAQGIAVALPPPPGSDATRKAQTTWTPAYTLRPKIGAGHSRVITGAVELVLPHSALGLARVGINLHYADADAKYQATIHEVVERGETFDRVYATLRH